MSTRCQTRITCEGLGWKDPNNKLLLYHHCDGYPSHMLPDFRKAYKVACGKNGDAWQAGRIGKVAAFLCAAHPAGFEPEKGDELHGDIEFLYELHIVN